MSCGSVLTASCQAPLLQVFVQSHNAVLNAQRALHEAHRLAAEAEKNTEDAEAVQRAVKAQADANKAQEAVLELEADMERRLNGDDAEAAEAAVARAQNAMGMPKVISVKDPVAAQQRLRREEQAAAIAIGKVAMLEIGEQCNVGPQEVCFWLLRVKSKCFEVCI